MSFANGRVIESFHAKIPYDPEDLPQALKISREPWPLAALLMLHIVIHGLVELSVSMPSSNAAWPSLLGLTNLGTASASEVTIMLGYTIGAAFEEEAHASTFHNAESELWRFKFQYYMWNGLWILSNQISKISDRWERRWKRRVSSYLCKNQKVFLRTEILTYWQKGWYRQHWQRFWRLRRRNLRLSAQTKTFHARVNRLQAENQKPKRPHFSDAEGWAFGFRTCTHWVTAWAGLQMNAKTSFEMALKGSSLLPQWR